MALMIIISKALFIWGNLQIIMFKLCSSSQLYEVFQHHSVHYYESFDFIYLLSLD